MATDFNKPVVTDAYATVLPGLVTANKDLAMMLEPTLTGTSTNLPTGAVRWNATTIRWERYNGTAWVTLPAAGNNVYAISISGNAATTTALATARTIGGVSFNGTANINLPGVNTAGNQNTSGNAATATKLATARTIGGVSFDGTANINLPGVNTTGNQNTTGNAATATTAASCSGNSATATVASGLTSTNSNWSSTAAKNNVVGMLSWRNFGDGHVVFDASGGTSPDATSISPTNSANPWISGHPTLMGWNGSATYGVRVDSARVADKLSTDTGNSPSYSCRAWVNFSGTGTVGIRASGNVSSITDNGTGDYTLNFLTAIGDVYYAVIATCGGTPGASQCKVYDEMTARSSSAVRIAIITGNGAGLIDASQVNVAVFR